MATSKIKAISAADKKANIVSLKDALKLSQAPLADSSKAVKGAAAAVTAAAKAHLAAVAKHAKNEAAAAKGKATIEAKIVAANAVPVLSAKEAKAQAATATELL